MPKVNCAAGWSIIQAESLQREYFARVGELYLPLKKMVKFQILVWLTPLRKLKRVELLQWKGGRYLSIRLLLQMFQEKKAGEWCLPEETGRVEKILKRNLYFPPLK